MSKFSFDEDDVLIADEDGDLTYDEAVNSTVEQCMAQIEASIWSLIDDLEYLADEEENDGNDDGAEEAQ